MKNNKDKSTRRRFLGFITKSAGVVLVSPFVFFKKLKASDPPNGGGGGFLGWLHYLIGAVYKWGGGHSGETPGEARAGGVDCSGLVIVSIQEDIPGYPGSMTVSGMRTDTVYHEPGSVSIDSVQTRDVWTFDDSSMHCGVVDSLLGNGWYRVEHASASDSIVKFSNVNSMDPFSSWNENRIIRRPKF